MALPEGGGYVERIKRGGAYSAQRIAHEQPVLGDGSAIMKRFPG